MLAIVDWPSSGTGRPDEAGGGHGQMARSIKIPQDRNYKLSPDPLVVQRNDVNEAGFQVTKLILESGLQLPFASYSGKHVVWYAGWQPSGFFGFKFNLHKEVGR